MSDKNAVSYEVPFKNRVQACWALFAEKESELRDLIDQKQDSDIITDKLNEMLSPAFSLVYAEVGFNKESQKYDLILNLEGDWSRLFSLTYFKKQAPKEVLEKWNIFVGRQAEEKNVEKTALNMGGNRIDAADIDLWVDWEDGAASVFVYCEKLVPLLEKDKAQAYNIIYILLDHALGELPEMKYIKNLELLTAPREKAKTSLISKLFKKSEIETPLKLGTLQQNFIENLGLSREELLNEERYADMYSGYRQDPDPEAVDALRKDVIAGLTCFVPVLNDFWCGESDIADTFRNDGIAVGYLAYPLNGFDGENKSAAILDFRDMITTKLEKTPGDDSFKFIGGATGVNFGYIDFIAWDLRAVLDNAVTIFKETNVKFVLYHSFDRNDDTITLYR